jgi:hypothetical protein
MASASTAVALYASVISASQLFGTQPEDAAELKHHAKGGKGFLNPWESFKVDRTPFEFMKLMIMYELEMALSVHLN